MNEENKEVEAGQPEEVAPNRESVLLGILQDLKTNLENAISILGGSNEGSRLLSINSGGRDTAKIIEGVFSGNMMIGGDGERYQVPANYASKSKLVEGDILKLTITSGGNFVYKQIGPIARKRMVGELAIDHEKDEHWVVNENEKWKILKASVSYFKGLSGDKITFMIPQDGPSRWAAVENIIKDNEVGVDL